MLKFHPLYTPSGTKKFAHWYLESGFISPAEFPALSRGKGRILNFPLKREWLGQKITTDRPGAYGAANRSREAKFTHTVRGPHLEMGQGCSNPSRYGLHHAIRDKRLDRVRSLLERQPGCVEETEEDGYTPLHRAAMLGQRQTVEVLLENGADMTARAPGSDSTALHIAVGRGYDDVVRALVRHKADLEASAAMGYKPLHMAAEKGYSDIVVILRTAGAKLTAETYLGLTAQDVAKKKLEDLLLEMRKRADSSQGTAAMPLDELAGTIDMLYSLIEYGDLPKGEQGKKLVKDLVKFNTVLDLLGPHDEGPRLAMEDTLIQMCQVLEKRTKRIGSGKVRRQLSYSIDQVEKFENDARKMKSSLEASQLWRKKWMKSDELLREEAANEASTPKHETSEARRPDISQSHAHTQETKLDAKPTPSLWVTTGASMKVSANPSQLQKPLEEEREIADMKKGSNRTCEPATFNSRLLGKVGSK